MSLCVSRARLAPTILFTCGMLVTGAGIVFAQQGPPPGGGSPGMRSRGDRSQSFDPVIFQGPPVPDSMAALVGLDPEGLARYATMYQNLMTATRSERDSLAAMRQAMRASRESGTGPQERGGMGGMRDLRQYLEDQQRQFDNALGDVLSKDQFKRYHDWRDQRRHEAESEMRSRRESRGGRSGDPQHQ